MQPYLYPIVFVILLGAELLYFRVARRLGIVDRPNARSSHSKETLRGGGIIFTIAVALWAIFEPSISAVPFVVGLLLVSIISFVDDIHSLPDSIRLAVQFAAMLLMFWSLDLLHPNMWWIVLIALVLSVGIVNVYNFMDGINGITSAYSAAVLIPLLLLNRQVKFVSESLIVVVLIGIFVFSIFNFRPKGKALCFSGDVGSVGMAFIVLFILGNAIIATKDASYLVLLVVYGIDACLTICHRILLHENLGVAHRKHMYQIMSNELNMGHLTVSLIYAVVQLAISLSFVYFVPNTLPAHWLFLLGIVVVLGVVYVLFMKKYYHLHKDGQNI